MEAVQDAARRLVAPAGGDVVEEGLAMAVGLAMDEGIQTQLPRGNLLPARAALAFVPKRRRESLSRRFWLGCLAVQTAHEALRESDKVLGRNASPRSASPQSRSQNPEAATLWSDPLLAGIRRVASMADSKKFLPAFSKAVEDAFLGEKMRAEASLRGAPQDGYLEIARARSGSLFGAAAGLDGWLGRRDSANANQALGVELGALSQLVDDFLDYCPLEETGKPKLRGFRGRAWTSALGDQSPAWFDLHPDEAVQTFFLSLESGDGALPSMAAQAVARLRALGSDLNAKLKEADVDRSVAELVDRWIRRCESASRKEAERLRLRRSGWTGRPAPLVKGRSDAPSNWKHPGETPASAALADRARALGPPEAWNRFFRRNSRSFSFAALLFPKRQRERVRGIYAWCRFTDDLADNAQPPFEGERLHELLDCWIAICRAAYDGRATGVPLADIVMGEMAKGGVPFSFALDIVEGVRMDVEPRLYRDMDELRVYTCRVASVLGAWLSYAFGVRDGWAIERAHALGHAMQLTNIIRDVGEDLEQGRLYLPLDRLIAHGLSREMLLDPAVPKGPGSSYAALMEELMAVADAAYSDAYEAMPCLPASARRAVAAAASVYQGIHDRVRANGYDNLSKRAYTSLSAKLLLAMRGCARLWSLRQGQIRAGSAARVLE